ncbi:sensor histidine kinase [Siccirubricoccus sp. G192]|uniref:sensor histidine kinase n=1 Tax=Siccirubricoccus sp. G192 TaxID=2849651 RepID=UPI001C2BD4E3|nr:HWE histidine kinase domain-containing protein [Siccirubricoccus sp. G192]MBV1796994.1 PAS domain-containing protein [Siccirubricoccus sp. G192]
MCDAPDSPSPDSPPSDPGHADAAEAARLAALQRYQVLDTPTEPAFDRLAALARDLLQAPIGLVSLIDGTRQWFKARIGLELRETQRDWAFCDHTIRGPAGAVMVVPDAAADPRFAASPLVTQPPHLRFYAGAPLVAPGGLKIGTISVASRGPRPAGLSKAQCRWLAALADLAMDELGLRAQSRLAREAAAQASLAWQAESRLRRAQEAAGVVAFELGAAGANEAGAALRALYGLPAEGRIDFTAMLAAVHPEDRAFLTAERARLATGGGGFRHEYRVIHPDGRTRWLQTRGEAEPGPAGGPPGRIAGIVMDVTDRKEAEQRQALLAREVDHRAKNMLAVVQAALRLTQAGDLPSFVAAVEGRIAALARAQTLLTESGWVGADLRAVAAGELAPYVTAAGEPRARLDGPPVALAPHAAQPLSMALHELATNAARHGALSAGGGRVSVTWGFDPAGTALWLRWAESGGPPLAGPPARRGFGTRMLERTVRNQLGGSLEIGWVRSGLVCDIRAPLARVLAGARA